MTTDADRRFFALRASGYTGPIDQDGHPVDDLDQWIADHTTEVAPSALRPSLWWRVFHATIVIFLVSAVAAMTALILDGPWAPAAGWLLGGSAALLFVALTAAHFCDYRTDNR